jgi:hypothetical protein
MKYLLTGPMMVLAFQDNHQAAVTIPAGTCIEVVGPVEDDDRFLLISAEDGQFHIFASDLAGRTKPVVARKPAKGARAPSSQSGKQPARSGSRAVT